MILINLAENSIYKNNEYLQFTIPEGLNNSLINF